MTPRRLSLAKVGMLLIVAITPLMAQAQNIDFIRIVDGDMVSIDEWTNGAAWADYDRDGHLDLFVPEYDVANALYRNNGDGTFTRVAGTPMEQSTGRSIAAAWGDFDNDGWVDLFVANTAVSGPAIAANELYRNNGDGTFTQITEGALVTDTNWSLGGSWGDYDGDGYLDLFVPNFMETNALYHNNGDGTFDRITGGDVDQRTDASFTGVWIDYDLDGDLDLFVANNFGSSLPAASNELFRNDGGVLVRVEDTVLNQDGAESVSTSWADYDNDGDPDCFVANQNWNGHTNLLYRNDGGTFVLVTDINIVTDDTNNFGSAWVDVDNDGWIDLAVTANQSGNRFNKIYRNNGDGTFESLTGNPFTDDEERSLGMTWGDYNSDGKLDVYVCEQNDPNQLYLNATDNGNHWIALQLHGDGSNASGVGAQVMVSAGGTTQTRWQLGTNGSYCGNDTPLHFGLGEATGIDVVEIIWPSGLHQVVSDLQIDAVNVIYEESTVGVEDSGEESGQLPRSGLNLAQNHPNPFNPRTTIEYALDRSGSVRLAVYDLSGRLIITLVDEHREAGTHQIQWLGTDSRGKSVPSGMYLYRLETELRSVVRTMTLVK